MPYARLLHNFPPCHRFWPASMLISRPIWETMLLNSWIQYGIVMLILLQLKSQSKCRFSVIQMQRFPFNTKTPIGFSVAFVLQYLLLVNLLIIPKCFYLIGIAILPMLFSLIDDTKRDLIAIQETGKSGKKYGNHCWNSFNSIRTWDSYVWFRFNRFCQP